MSTFIWGNGQARDLLLFVPLYNSLRPLFSPFIMDRDSIVLSSSNS